MKHRPFEGWLMQQALLRHTVNCRRRDGARSGDRKWWELFGARRPPTGKHHDESNQKKCKESSRHCDTSVNHVLTVRETLTG